MPFTYIRRNSFEDFLSSNYGSFYEVPVADNIREIVYDIPTQFSDVVVRIYSSILLEHGVSRDVGRDAIRVVLFNTIVSFEGTT